MNTEINYADIFCSEDQNDADQLEKNVADFPASSVARFMLLYHYKKNNLPGFQKLAKQTGIYLNNTSWIQFQLNQIAKTDVKNSNEPISMNEESLAENTADDSFGKEQATGNFSLENHPEKEVSLEENKEGLISNFENNPEENELPPNEILKEIPETLDDENSNKTAEANEQSSAVNEQITGNFSQENERKSVLDIKIPPEEQNKSESETSESGIFPEEDEETEINFEPLHTVDYFASQGIKITEEDLANDHLGKQVKSFTAWLKSMKKLHPGQLPEQNEVIEKIIQSSSESSNQDAHVLTEAMAEVLVKQGKKEKAIEMYEKLSLLNPSKSAYFAAKIESLKIV